MRGDPGYRPLMRDGVPLPGVSPTVVVSQLAYRVFGPLHLHRVRIVLDFHGADGRPAGTRDDIAARHGVSNGTVFNHARAVREVGVRLPLRPETVSAASRPSTPGDDHLARVRIARTLGLPAPEVPSAKPDRPPVRPGALNTANATVRLLAAVGPLSTETLLVALARSRRFRHRAPMAAAELDVALAVLGATRRADGNWQAPPGAIAPARYQVIAATAAGKDLTRADMIQVLISAGYHPESAGGLMSSSHPLFHRVGPDHYRIIGHNTTDEAPRPGHPPAPPRSV